MAGEEKVSMWGTEKCLHFVFEFVFVIVILLALKNDN